MVESGDSRPRYSTRSGKLLNSGPRCQLVMHIQPLNGTRYLVVMTMIMLGHISLLDWIRRPSMPRSVQFQCLMFLSAVDEDILAFWPFLIISAEGDGRLRPISSATNHDGLGHEVLLLSELSSSRSPRRLSHGCRFVQTLGPSIVD